MHSLLSPLWQPRIFINGMLSATRWCSNELRQPTTMWSFCSNTGSLNCISRHTYGSFFQTAIGNNMHIIHTDDRSKVSSLLFYGLGLVLIWACSRLKKKLFWNRFYWVCIVLNIWKWDLRWLLWKKRGNTRLYEHT